MLAVAGGKGGCGKTTTALGVALAAGHRGREPLVVDADVDVPDLHLVAGVDRRPALGDGPPDVVARPVPGHPSVDVLPAPGGEFDGSFVAALDRCRRARDLVLVDSPAGAGRDAVRPLRVADRTLVVTTPEPACLRDAAKTAAMSRAVGTPVAGVVVTRAAQAPAVVDHLLGTSVVEAVPTVDRPLRSRRAISAFDRIRRRVRDRRP